jgi:hypothetical protein
MQGWERKLVAVRQEQEKAEITIYFKANRPEASEILALRPCHPGFRQMEPAKIRNNVGDSGRLRVLDLNGTEAHELLRALRKAGFSASMMTNKVVRYVPFDRRTAGPLAEEESARELTNAVVSAGLHLAV